MLLTIKKAQNGAGGYVGDAGDEVGNNVGNKAGDAKKN